MRWRLLCPLSAAAKAQSAQILDRGSRGFDPVSEFRQPFVIGGDPEHDLSGRPMADSTGEHAALPRLVAPVCCAGSWRHQDG
jgi:hypothetical protein